MRRPSSSSGGVNRTAHVSTLKKITHAPIALPTDFDARTQWPGCVGGILDQGRCGAVVWSKQALSDVTLQRTQTEVDAWRKSVDITIVNSTCPPPILTFEEAAMFIPTQVVASFKKQNFIAFRVSHGALG